MRSADLVRPLALLVLAGCGGGGGGGGGTTVGGGGETNVMKVSVNGALCNSSTSAGYVNKPCVQVTVCAPGTSQCRTVSDILLDTGSYGLRIFKQALGTLPLQQVQAGSGSLATCVRFADNTSDWGPVQVADVVLAGEPAVRVPIHVLDPTFSAVTMSTCPNPEKDPSSAGFNGILGVGVFAQDCGDRCASPGPNGIYFSCGSSGCIDSMASLADQVSNPVFLLQQDNNGLIIQLPAVAANGAPSAEGTVVLGIGTRANNSPAGVVAVPVDPRIGTFTTVLAGTALDSSFLDTGSNGLFFAPPSSTQLPACSGNASAWFCPPSTVSLTATNPSGDVSFKIGNFEAMTAGNGNNVFPEAGGDGMVGRAFDWGLPFYLGRRVAVGFEQRGSSLGTGPLVAY